MHHAKGNFLASQLAPSVFQPRSSIRLRVALALGLAVLPFMTVLVLAYTWIYQPMQKEIAVLSRDVESRFDSVAKLQVALARAAMPVNDYLINGLPQEKRDFQLTGARVEAAFVAVRNSILAGHSREHQKIDVLYERWQRSYRQGDAILGFNDDARKTPHSAAAMKAFDSGINQLIDGADELLDHVRKDMHEFREQTQLRRDRMTWFLMITVMLATVVSLVAVVYLGQLIPNYHDRRDGIDEFNAPDA